MSILSRLFGGKGETGPAGGAQPETYEGFTIFPEPRKEGSRWRLAARIEKEVGGEVKVHQLVRADTFDDRETAEKESAAKARVMIDQTGEGMFG